MEIKEIIEKLKDILSLELQTKRVFEKDVAARAEAMSLINIK